MDVSAVPARTVHVLPPEVVPPINVGERQNDLVGDDNANICVAACASRIRKSEHAYKFRVRVNARGVQHGHASAPRLLLKYDGNGRGVFLCTETFVEKSDTIRGPSLESSALLLQQDTGWTSDPRIALYPVVGTSDIFSSSFYVIFMNNSKGKGMSGVLSFSSAIDEGQEIGGEGDSVQTWRFRTVNLRTLRSLVPDVGRKTFEGVGDDRGGDSLGLSSSKEMTPTEGLGVTRKNHSSASTISMVPHAIVQLGRGFGPSTTSSALASASISTTASTTATRTTSIPGTHELHGEPFSSSTPSPANSFMFHMTRSTEGKVVQFPKTSEAYLPAKAIPPPNMARLRHPISGAKRPRDPWFDRDLSTSSLDRQLKAERSLLATSRDSPIRRTISASSLLSPGTAIRRKTGFGLDFFVSRKEVEDVFRGFLSSSKIICVLLGRAGFGKTVYLRHLHEENSPISLFFDGSEVSEIEQILKGNIQLEEQHPAVRIIFIDAINEGNAGRFVSMILSNLSKLRERELRIVMTCRTEWWKALGRCGRLEVLSSEIYSPLVREGRVNRSPSSINLWNFSADEQQQIRSELVKRLQRSVTPREMELLSTPLMLEMHLSTIKFGVKCGVDIEEGVTPPLYSPFDAVDVYVSSAQRYVQYRVCDKVGKWDAVEEPRLMDQWKAHICMLVGRFLEILVMKMHERNRQIIAMDAIHEVFQILLGRAWIPSLTDGALNLIREEFVQIHLLESPGEDPSSGSPLVRFRYELVLEVVLGKFFFDDFLKIADSVGNLDRLRSVLRTHEENMREGLLGSSHECFLVRKEAIYYAAMYACGSQARDVPWSNIRSLLRELLSGSFCDYSHTGTLGGIFFRFEWKALSCRIIESLLMSVYTSADHVDELISMINEISSEGDFNLRWPIEKIFGRVATVPASDTQPIRRRVLDLLLKWGREQITASVGGSTEYSGMPRSVPFLRTVVAAEVCGFWGSESLSRLVDIMQMYRAEFWVFRAATYSLLEIMVRASKRDELLLLVETLVSVCDQLEDFRHDRHPLAQLLNHELVTATVIAEVFQSFSSRQTDQIHRKYHPDFMFHQKHWLYQLKFITLLCDIIERVEDVFTEKHVTLAWIKSFVVRYANEIEKNVSFFFDGLLPHADHLTRSRVRKMAPNPLTWSVVCNYLLRCEFDDGNTVVEMIRRKTSHIRQRADVSSHTFENNFTTFALNCFCITMGVRALPVCAPTSRVGIVFHPDFLERASFNHPECPERMHAILNHLIPLDWIQWFCPGAPFSAIPSSETAPSDRRVALTEDTPGDIESEEWIETDENATTVRDLGEDSALSARIGLLHMASEALIAMETAVDITAKSIVDFAFGLVRPPGHLAHVYSNKVCVHNNIAHAVTYYLSRFNPEGKILILDFDNHHGLGTFQQFYANKNVLFIGVHEENVHPCSGSPNDLGTGSALGTSYTMRVPNGAGDLAYKLFVKEFFIPIAKSWNPDMIFLSAGFDSHESDQFCSMNCTFLTYQWIGNAIRKISLMRDPRAPVVASLEGGYGLETIGACIETFCNCFRPGCPGEFVEALNDSEERAHISTVVRLRDQIRVVKTTLKDAVDLDPSLETFRTDVLRRLGKISNPEL
eukprot:TRINITY_DN7252_c0_g1_i2.p1 TRINITY_DN7252_c0_g1~~TRINITY_DN7252_c0_g1_i2.p1  ORF type:complete len:1691 (-),score=403.89 TRINITY_DN7252_c0_g1_i2:141-4979(-)